MEQVRVVTIQASPAPGSGAFSEHGGAFINIYTTEQSEAAALDLAAREVRNAGWVVESIEEHFLLTRADLLHAPEGLQYFEQALIDGIVLVIHTYAPGPKDDDVVH